MCIRDRGNEQIHALSKDGRCKLRFDVQQQSSSSWFWAEYSTFVVADETDNYQLTVAGFSGSVSHDAFGQHHGNVFATSDRDVAAGCAQSVAGGFWTTTAAVPESTPQVTSSTGISCLLVTISCIPECGLSVRNDPLKAVI